MIPQMFHMQTAVFCEVTFEILISKFWLQKSKS